jgi:hypothetical protein
MKRMGMEIKMKENKVKMGELDGVETGVFTDVKGHLFYRIQRKEGGGRSLRRGLQVVGASTTPRGVAANRVTQLPWSSDQWLPFFRVTRASIPPIGSLGCVSWREMLRSIRVRHRSGLASYVVGP